jgi:hypothetical protein
VSRPALGPTQPPVQWVPGVLSPGVKRGRGVTLTTYPHLVPRSWISRSYTSSPPSASMACSGTAFNFTLFHRYRFSGQWELSTHKHGPVEQNSFPWSCPRDPPPNFRVHILSTSTHNSPSPNTHNAHQRNHCKYFAPPPTHTKETYIDTFGLVFCLRFWAQDRMNVSWTSRRPEDKWQSLFSGPFFRRWVFLFDRTIRRDYFFVAFREACYINIE